MSACKGAALPDTCEWIAQLVKPMEASTEVLQDVHTQEYLDQLHSSSRKVCPAQGAWISIAA